MVQYVYVVQPPRLPAFPLTVIESIAVGFIVGGHFTHVHQDVSPGALGMGALAFFLYWLLHRNKATAWIVLIAGAIIWGGIGYGIAHGAWPGHWIAQSVCAGFGGLISLGEKACFYENQATN